MRDLTEAEAAWMFCTHRVGDAACDRTPVACSDGYPSAEWSGQAWCRDHVPAWEPIPLLGVM